MLELPKSETLTLLESIHGLWNILLWVFSGTGLMSVSATPRSIFFRTSALDTETLSLSPSSDLLDASSPSNIPDAEIMIQPVSSFERHVPGYSLITLYPTLVQPVSRGKIELVSKDPLANPKIFHPMLQDERDLVPFRKAIRFTMRLAEEFVLKSGYPLQPVRLTFAPGVNPHLLEAWEATAPPYEVTDKVTAEVGYTFASKADGTAKSTVEPAPVTCKTWRDVTDDEIDDYIRRVGMGSMHVASSCPMAKDRDTGGVVDQKLRVHGIRNLRIADASVFPKVPSCHTMAPTIMVAERCAGFVTEAWRGR
jgi:choline dehydrogenase-like flavoprotein